jgi:phosphate transport system substrate-binding protein
MNNSSWCAVLATVVGIGYLGALNDGGASAETLKIQGSSGFADDVMEPYQDRIEALTHHKLDLVVNTTGEGLLALLKGEADLAMVSAPLESMVALLRKSRPDLPFSLLRDFRVGEARVAFPVNPGNPVRSVSLAKLKQILNGQIGNWRELGGPDLAIHVVSTREGGGTKRTTEEILLGGQRITPRSEIIMESPPAVVQTVAQDRGALGITQAGLVKGRLPELETKVLIKRSYSLVSLNEPTAAMRAVIAATRSIVFDERP